MRILVSGNTRKIRELASSGNHSDRLGHLFVPGDRNSTAGTIETTGLPWAADNGAFSGFDPIAFTDMMDKLNGHQSNCLFVACPDVVGDAKNTLELFEVWEPVLRRFGWPIALVGQDGLEDHDIQWNRIDAFFVGGSTDWKLSDDAAGLIVEAKLHGKHVHMGRVNSRRRICRAINIGCDSIDGSSFSRFPDKKLERTLQWMQFEEAQARLPGLISRYSALERRKWIENGSSTKE